MSAGFTVILKPPQILTLPPFLTTGTMGVVHSLNWTGEMIPLLKRRSNSASNLRLIGYGTIRVWKNLGCCPGFKIRANLLYWRHLRPTHSPKYKCCGPTVWNIDQFELRKQYLHCKMARKQRWPPVLSKIDQEWRENYLHTWTTQHYVSGRQKPQRKNGGRWSSANHTGLQLFLRRKVRRGGFGRAWKKIVLKPPHPLPSSGLQKWR